MRKIDFLVVVVTDELDGFFEHGHHAEAEQIHLDDAHIGAVFFIPLHDYAPGHRSRFERDHGIELSLADDHTSRMLAEMAWQILHGGAKFEIFAQARVIQIQAGVMEAPIERVVGILIFPGGDSGRNFV